MRHICEDAVDELFDKLYPEQINLKSFEAKKDLNPAIWKNGMLRANVRSKLIEIAKEFVGSIKMQNLPIVDIIVVGSSASYNWSKYSDIDLHILVDFSKISTIDDEDTLKDYFASKKNDWNTKHENLTIYGYPVELYIQGSEEINASEGVYSVKSNYWLKQPVAHDMLLDKTRIKNQAANLCNRIDDFVEAVDRINNKQKLKVLEMIINRFYESVCQSRKDGLNTEGESSPDNITFKVLRRTGHLGKCRELKFKLYDKINSI